MNQLRRSCSRGGGSSEAVSRGGALWAVVLLFFGAEWAEAAQWTALGQRWAVLRDGQGRAEALYDLSFPEFEGYLPLGLIGDRRIKTGELIRIIATAGKETRVDEQEAEESIAMLSQQSEDALGEQALPTQWWKTVPWKKSARVKTFGSLGGASGVTSAAESDAPVSFLISDIDLKAASKKNQKKLEKALVEVEARWAAIAAANPEVGAGSWTTHFALQSVDSGHHYELSFVKPGFMRGPKKITDFQDLQWGFNESLNIELLEESIGQVVNLLNPTPVVSAIVKTALDRYFHYRRLTVRSHQHMAIELLNALQENDRAFRDLGGPTGLTDAEIQKGLESLVFATQSMWSNYKWIWKRPSQEWLSQQRDVWSNSERSIEWLVEKGEWHQPFNARFAIARGSGGLTRLLQLGMRKPDRGDGPFASYDEQHPSRLRRQRIAVEALTTAVTFCSKFVPLAGGLLRRVYRRVVEGPVNRAKAWEGRLLTQLEQRQVAYGEDWRQAIAVLESQRVNPLAPSREKTRRLIERRRLELGLITP
jgi:hypothetical protein